MLRSGGRLREAQPLLVCLFLTLGVIGALAILLSVESPVRAQTTACETSEKPRVPGAEEQDEYCLLDLTTEGLVDGIHTNRSDWGPPIPLHSAGTVNPAEPVPGLQIDGYFPDDSSTNCNNFVEFGECRDSQFVIRFPENWNGKLVITGAPGVRRQYANDFIISDWVLARGYAFASTDKGNTGDKFYRDGQRPGGAVAEWHRRVEELTEAAKVTVERWYGKAPDYTYITGISNGGYLTRYALENNPELYDGGVDWEGTLFRRNGPNLFTHLPPALRHYPECQAGDQSACERMIRAGYEPDSEFLWPEHYAEYWDITQRIFREEFDPGYDGDQEAGYPMCQEETSPPPKCDANYRYKKRPERVKDAVGRVSLTGKIGKPMLTLHGTLDALLPIDLHSNTYRRLVENAGKDNLHRYYKIEDGNHVDSYYDRYPREGETALRPILPCHRAAFVELEEWVEEGNEPPRSKLVPNPKEGDEANRCSLGKEAEYSPPVG